VFLSRLIYKNHKNPEIPTETEESRIETAMRALANLKDQNAPQRKYMRKDLDKISDRQMKIQSTLLEYDQKSVLLSGILAQQQQQAQQQQKESSKLSKAQIEQQQQANKQNLSELEEANLNRLINEMAETDQKQSKISANAVGQILGLQQSTLQQIVSDYNTKVRILGLFLKVSCLFYLSLSTCIYLSEKNLCHYSGE
jgi:hypothetical protein